MNAPAVINPRHDILSAPRRQSGRGLTSPAITTIADIVGVVAVY